MTQTEALKLALEALEDSEDQLAKPYSTDVRRAITAIKEALAQPERHELQAEGKHPAPCARFCEANAFQIEIRNLKARLAQPEQEPVAWADHGVVNWIADKQFKHASLLYTTPYVATPRPQRKPLTDEQKQAMRLYKAVERLSLQAGEETDESVDWLCGEHGGMFKLYEAYFSPKKPDVTCPTCESLSRAVMADHVFHDKLTKPLTDERLEEMWEADTTSSDDCKSLYFFKLVARAIEAAHGIKE